VGRWRSATSIPARLNPLAEDMERTSSGYDEHQGGDPVHRHTPAASFPKMPPLDLDSDEETGACTPVNQFSMKETERGEGTVALED
jgi:hypothetical protein